jgi:PAS domain S-box-containing protein
MEPPARPFRPKGSARAFALLAAGAALSLAGFFFAREAHRKEVEAEFRANAQDHAEAVGLGLQRGFETVLILRDHFTASGDFDAGSFQAFAGPTLERHPYIQALQWLPEVTPANRADLETLGRRIRPDFRFFCRDSQGSTHDFPPGQTFHAVFFVEPVRGNEVAIGYSAAHLETRQAMIRTAVETGQLTSSGRIRLIQESGGQWGLLVAAAVPPGRHGRPRGLVQGVFRCGDLVEKSLAFLEPKGLDVNLLDATAPEEESLLHAHQARIPGAGPRTGELRLARRFDLAGRSWTVEVRPAAGRYAMAPGLRAWALLGAGLAFTILLAVYLRNLLARETEVREQVETRTQDLARETESHRRDAQALAVAEARYRQLVEVMGEGMWVVDRSGATIFVNHRMEEMLGVPRGSLVGRKISDFLFPENAAGVRRLFSKVAKGHAIQQEIRFRRGDGAELWTLVTGNPIEGESGAVDRVIGIISDITERRKNEELLRQSQKLESLGVLAGGIAHDFNNLLTAILGNLNLARMHLSTLSPALTYFDKLEKTVHRATNLTRQMLAYSGKGRFIVGPLDLNLAVKEMSHLLEVSLPKKVSLRFQLKPGLPLMMADASQIQQVVMNLVTNAAEAIGDNVGTVTVRTGADEYSAEALARDFPSQAMDPGQYLLLEVADTGQGMSPEVQARIFEPFFTTKFTGRGLGLSAMQGILRGHRGGIRIYSEVGNGTVFKLLFPATSETEILEFAQPEEPEWKGSGTVLVVDDEEDVRSVAEDLLRNMGFEVACAADGREALQLFVERPGEFRAVLMDLTMPNMNGVETFRELRRVDPKVRVVLTSGYNEQDAVHDFTGKGLAAFVQKPFQLEDLRQAIRKALEG